MLTLTIFTAFCLVIGIVLLAQVRISRKFCRTRFEAIDEKLRRMERALDRACDAKRETSSEPSRPARDLEREAQFERIAANTQLIRERVLSLTGNLDPEVFESTELARFQRIRRVSRATATTRTLVEIGEFSDGVTESLKPFFGGFQKFTLPVSTDDALSLTKPAYFRVNLENVSEPQMILLLETVRETRPWGHVFGFENVRDSQMSDRLRNFSETGWPGTVMQSGNTMEFLAEGPQG